MIVISPLSFADWFQEQEALIENYLSFNDLRKSSESRPKFNFVKGKYESESDFKARVISRQETNIQTFYVENVTPFSVPNASAEVEFSYSPFETLILSSGAENSGWASQAAKKYFEPNRFELPWPSGRAFLYVDKAYLQETDADVVTISIISIDFGDPASFGFTWDGKVAQRVQSTAYRISGNESLLKGNVVAVGLYNKKNNTVLGVFSATLDHFYYSYNKKTVALGKKKVEKFNIMPISVAQPVYPRRAMTRGKEGYAIMSFTVITAGDVRDPILVEEFPEGWGFGRAAIKAAPKLKYRPAIVDGVRHELEGIMYKFEFNMAK